MSEEKVDEGDARRWRGWWLGMEEVGLDLEGITA